MLLLLQKYLQSQDILRTNESIRQDSVFGNPHSVTNDFSVILH